MDTSLDQYRIPNAPEAMYYIPNFLSAEEGASLLAKIPTNRWTHLSARRLQAHPSTLHPKTNTLLAAPLPPWLTAPVIPRLLSLTTRQCEEKESPSPLQSVEAEASPEVKDGKDSKEAPSSTSSQKPVAQLHEKVQPHHVFHATPHRTPNHVLVNEYLPGQGIMPHEDGPAYASVVATVSLEGSIVLDVWEKENEEKNRQSESEGDSEGDGGDGGNTSSHDLPRLRLVARIYQEPGSLLITTGRAYEAYLHGIDGVAVDRGVGPISSSSSSSSAAAAAAPTSITHDTATTPPLTNGNGNCADSNLSPPSTSTTSLSSPQLGIANYPLLSPHTRARLEASAGVSERTRRVSLTYRDVRRVSDVARKILFATGGGRGRS